MAAALEAVTKAGQVFTHNEKSTGRLTSDVEKKGNYSANFVVTYENLAINVVTSNKRKDWEIIYPTYGVMNDHPIIVLTTDPDKQAAAKHYVEYLTGKSAQLIAVKQFGFRPAHKDVDMFVEGSPFANKVLEGKLNLEPPAVEPPADSGALYSLIEAYEGGK
jgi:ABC-type sulfate transport system substrate-binding protein